MISNAKNALFGTSVTSLSLFAVTYALLFICHVQFVAFVTKVGKCRSLHSDEQSSDRQKLIIYATTFFEDGEIADAVSRNQISQCTHLNCRVVSAIYREYCFLEASAMIFHPIFADFVRVMPFFKRRRRNLLQPWVFLSYESPDTINKLLPRELAFYDWANGKFNLTMTYRWDSDVPSPYLRHDTYVRRSDGERVPFDRENYRKKTRHIAAVASNCQDNYGRLDYLRQLRSYGLTVDIYGKCGDYYCPGRASSECYLLLEQKYYFYAAAENSICTDYISEKFFYALPYKMVNVVMGGANYTRIGPPHSFISSLDFRSAEELASKLKEIALNETAYEEYFLWQGLYRFSERPYDSFCTLCAQLEKPIHKVIDDLKTWWLVNSGCTSNPYRSTQDSY